MEENSEEREDTKEEEGGNILDDILNTKEEKFEDEETIKKDEEDEENDLDLGDEDSPEGSTREEDARKGPESDFSDSEDEESKAILRDGRDSDMSFKVRKTPYKNTFPSTLFFS